MQQIFAAAAMLLGLSMATGASAGPNHAEFEQLKGPFKNGPEVTKQCLVCHEKAAKDFMKGVHWTWSKEQTVAGKKTNLGKKNAVNNYCISLSSNWPRCTSCHAGYGWKDGSFDFSKAENVDCLVCHDTTGSYKKHPASAGHPAYAGENKEWPAKSGKLFPVADLVKVAQAVGAPSRSNCGTCHFFGGGGDHVKHGDIDSSLAKPSADIDVHMGKLNFTCQSCHKGADHQVKGEALSVSVGSGARTLNCVDCHKGDKEPHKSGPMAKHVKKIACQTCHIQTFAKALPTKMWWDWSTAGKDLKPEEIKKDKYGEKLYDKMKGDFVWEKDVIPTYYWFNGKVDRLLLGDKIDPSKVVKLSAAQGSKADPNSKLMPFKVMKGKQPFDKVNNTMVAVNTFGPNGYWNKYDWKLAIETGMKAAAQPFSGEFGFVETSMVWSVNHMVSPKAKSLKCMDCHGEKGRLDWKALGYAGDPMKKK